MKRTHHLLPRPVCAIICSVCVILLAALYYISLGCPTLTFRQEFRRAEKANLVGPSVIADQMENSHDDYDDMIVGHTDHGVSFLCRRKEESLHGPNKWQYTFTHTPKTGDLTVAAAPNVFGAFWGAHDTSSHLPENLPVYIFSTQTDAVRAEISMMIEGTSTTTVNDEEISRHYKVHLTGQAVRLEDGIFKVVLTSQTTDEAFALYALSTLASGTTQIPQAHKSITIPVTVGFYDGQDNLISEQTVTLTTH